MEDCNNPVDTDLDYLWDKEAEGYACDTCMSEIGDQ